MELGDMTMSAQEEIARGREQVAVEKDQLEGPIGWVILQAINGLDSKISLLESRVDSRLSAMESRVDSKISGLEVKVESKIGGLDSKIHSLDVKVDGVMASLTSRLDGLSASLNNRIDSLSSSLVAKIDSDVREVRQDSKTQLWVSIGTIVATILASAGVVISVITFVGSHLH